MRLDATISNVLAGDALATPATAMHNDAFAAFYERSARPLWAYLARVSGDGALADDLLQESYVRFLCADTNLDGEVAARKYLFRIATNLMKDHWRKPRVTSMDEIPEEHFSGNGTSGQVETEMMLGPALKQMRPRERQLLWLAYAEGYSHREIAEVTGLASASIRLLLFRARRKVARLITDRATDQSAGRAQ
ncbi:RNA polymerase sigma factor [Terracidiphilus gabretensis]|uniref:RNA polymerase sigma factor n=1 Tax=Terracidiphilus gabretensis TaxID=1577687 RepID=UPI0018D2004A|nr:sigma-70 family RNA polymerase sigma factor [Terracidiphilus gabretensis]